MADHTPVSGIPGASAYLTRKEWEQARALEQHLAHLEQLAKDRIAILKAFE